MTKDEGVKYSSSDFEVIITPDSVTIEQKEDRSTVDIPMDVFAKIVRISEDVRHWASVCNVPGCEIHDGE